MIQEPSAEAVAGEVVIGGRYRVVRHLGGGGMGTVYEAENTFTKGRVALKLMRPEVARVEVYAQRFLREAQAATRLEHPNIVRVLDMGRDEAIGSLFMVQEFLTGHDLGKHLEAAGRMPPGDALALVVPVMEALAFAHERGVIHRDLKPDNIFLSETPRGVVPKLIDFGIAKVTDPDEGRKTMTGMVMGSPYYMSPEQAKGESDLDARSDVWSMGAVLYELLAGTRPYRAPNSNTLIAKIIYEEPTPLAVAAPDLPRDLADAVMSAVRKNRDERYPSMQAFIDAMREWVLTQTVQAPAPRAMAVHGVQTSGPQGVTDVTDATVVSVPVPLHTPVPGYPSSPTSIAVPGPEGFADSLGGTLAPTATAVLPMRHGSAGRVFVGLCAAGACVALVALWAGRGPGGSPVHPVTRAANVPVTAVVVERPTAPVPVAVHGAVQQPTLPVAPLDLPGTEGTIAPGPARRQGSQAGVGGINVWPVAPASVRPGAAGTDRNARTTTGHHHGSVRAPTPPFGLAPARAVPAVQALPARAPSRPRPATAPSNGVGNL